MDKETSDLDLLVGIKSDQADVSIWESLGAALDFLDDLGAISAAEHWELPHCPVTVVKIVAMRSILQTHNTGVGDISLLSIGELKAWGPAVADNVINLLGDILLGERWEVGESLKEPKKRNAS